MRAAYSSFFFDTSGYGEMSRRYLFAMLQEEGLDVTPGVVMSDGGGRVPMTADMKTFVERRRVGPPDVHVICAAGMDLPKIQVQDIPPWIPRVGMMCWETDRLHDLTKEGLKSVRRVIVPSEHNREVCERAGFDAVVVPIPAKVPPYIDDFPLDGLEGVDDDTFVFYTMLTWQDRKNPFGIIAAFCHAFTDKDKVVLLLKINGPDANKATEVAARSTDMLIRSLGLKDAPDFRIIGGTMSTAKLWALHYRGDCYVSLSKGEAYGLPIIDAAAVGNQIISTAYGGQLDFLPVETSHLVSYRLGPVMQQYSHFHGRMLWAEPDIREAAEIMREVYARGRQPKIIPDMTRLLPYNIGTKLMEALAV